MSELLEYIEAYFEKALNDDEKRVFEKRCAEDEDFAKEVAFYISSRQAIRQKLLEQKQQQWRGIQTTDNRLEAVDERRQDINEREQIQAPTAPAPVRQMNFRKWLPYVAAASILLIVSLVYINENTPQSFADDYINNNYKQLSQTMDGSADSLQQGIAAYNNQDYDKALLLFQKVYDAHPDNSDAKKYIGLVYLLKKDYDKALLHFDELSQKKLHSNPGVFLKALTLLERNKGNDKDEAKKLLEQVVADGLEHDKEAKELLEKW